MVTRFATHATFVADTKHFLCARAAENAAAFCHGKARSQDAIRDVYPFCRPLNETGSASEAIAVPTGIITSPQPNQIKSESLVILH